MQMESEKYKLTEKGIAHLMNKRFGLKYSLLQTSAIFQHYTIFSLNTGIIYF